MSGLIVHEWIEANGGAEKVVAAMVEAFPDADVLALWDDAPGTLGAARVRESWLARTPLRRSKIAALQFCCDGQPIPLSVSVGATWITPAAGQSADILLGSADALLYRAKHQGRNRVVSGAAMADTPLA